MRALILREFGGPDVLLLESVPRPTPLAHEVLIEVATVAVNRQDVYTLAGRANVAQLALPHIAGNDPAGTVAEVGSAVTTLSVGDSVVVKPAIACGTCDWCQGGEEASCARLESVGVHRWGGFAEYVAVPASNVFPIPARVTFAEATALAQSAPVALHMLRERAQLAASDVVLVTSAAGAIGSSAVQLAKLADATVIAAAGGGERAEYARSLGADHVIDYRAEPEFASTVRGLAPSGVSVYIESAGNPPVWSEALKTLGRRARVVVCGSHAGPVVEVDLNWLLRTRVSILGSSGSTAAGFAEVLDHAGAGRLRANVDSIRPVAEFRSAFERILTRGNRGKVILELREGSASQPGRR